ncbi:MAG: hypothetical protein IT359_10775 [Gemmatimonadaceae bacterium]|nr:hypothetical protein [Gemmatimonadaceae bacterium]
MRHVVSATILALLPAAPGPAQSVESAAIVAYVHDAIRDEARDAERSQRRIARLVVLVEDSNTASEFSRSIDAALARAGLLTAPRTPIRLPGPDTMFVDFARPSVDSSTAAGVFVTVFAQHVACETGSPNGTQSLRSAAYRCSALVCTRLHSGGGQSGTGILCRPKD